MNRLRAELRGVSMAELLVGLVLMGLIGSLVAFHLRQTVRVSAKSHTAAALQQQGLITSRRLLADLKLSSAAGVSWHPSDGVVDALLVIHPLDALDSDARALYAERELIVYQWRPAQSELVRLSWNSSNPPPVQSPDREPLRFSRSEAETLAADGQAFRRLQNSVTRFSLDPGLLPPPNIESPLRLELELSAKAVAGQDVETYAFRGNLTFRNRL